jgi:hypothetical protein
VIFEVLVYALGDTLMVHASLRAIGPVEGRATGLARALLVVLGDRGTLQPFGQQAILRCPGYHAHRDDVVAVAYPHAALLLGYCALEAHINNETAEGGR